MLRLFDFVEEASFALLSLKDFLTADEGLTDDILAAVEGLTEGSLDGFSVTFDEAYYALLLVVIMSIICSILIGCDSSNTISFVSFKLFDLIVDRPGTSSPISFVLFKLDILWPGLLFRESFCWKEMNFLSSGETYGETSS